MRVPGKLSKRPAEGPKRKPRDIRRKDNNARSVAEILQVGPFKASEEIGRPRLLALLFCEHGNLTEDGKANLSGVFDEITLRPGTSAIVFHLFVRTAYTTGRLGITFYNPEGLAVAGGKAEVGQPPIQRPGRPYHLQLLNPVTVPIPGEGLYWAEVTYEGEVLGRAGLYVNLAEGSNQ